MLVIFVNNLTEDLPTDLHPQLVRLNANFFVRVTHTMLCNFHLKWPHCTWIAEKCDAFTKRKKKRFVYWCINLYVYVYKYVMFPCCVSHVVLCLCNGGNLDVLVQGNCYTHTYLSGM